MNSSGPVLQHHPLTDARKNTEMDGRLTYLCQIAKKLPATYLIVQLFHSPGESGCSWHLLGGEVDGTVTGRKEIS